MYVFLKLCFISTYWHRVIPDVSSESAVLTHIYDTAYYNYSSCCCSSNIVFLECIWFPNSLTSFQLPQCLTVQDCHLTCIRPLGQHSGNDLWLLYFKTLEYCITFRQNMSSILCYIIDSIAVMGFLQDAVVIHLGLVLVSVSVPLHTFVPGSCLTQP